MRTDTIFYQLFQTYPNLVFELMGLPPETAQGYQFLSVEVKEKAFRFDGILFPDSAEKTIWFVEVQFQKVENFYRQFIAEIILYLNQYQPVQDWRALAIYPDRQTEAPMPNHFRQLLDREKLIVVYLISEEIWQGGWSVRICGNHTGIQVEKFDTGGNISDVYHGRP
jgi:predicted transposase/invertase (TIGR01784 family)